MRMGLETIEYPVPPDELRRIISSQEIPHKYLLFWLERYSSVSPEDWETLEKAMLALVNLMAGNDLLTYANVAGESWRFKAAPVDLTKEVVTIQRKEHLLVAIQGSPQGSLVVSHYRPLDAKSIRYILDLAVNPQADGSVSMRPNNFEYAKDCSAGTGNFYAFKRGEAHLSYWEHGVGLDIECNPVDGWSEQQNLEPLYVSALAVQVGNYYELDDENYQ